MAAKRRVYSALLSFVSWDGVFRWWRPALYLFRHRFLRRDWGGGCTTFPRRSAFSSTCTPSRRSALGSRPTFVHLFGASLLFAVLK